MSSKQKLGCIILAAGDGTRLNSRTPKALHQICGRPMLYHVLKVAQLVSAAPIVIVIGHQGAQIQAAVKNIPDISFAWQQDRKGTGHAAICAREAIPDFDGDLLVMAGDTPLITEATLQQLVHRHRHLEAAATLLSTHIPDPTGYGRVLRYEDNTVQGVVEHKEANRYERAITEINVGTYCFDARKLFEGLERLRPDNIQGEYYLTDVVRIFVDDQQRVEAVTTEDWQETIGVNNRVQLAEAEQVLRERIRQRHMLAGVTMVYPSSTFVDDTVVIGQDTVLGARADVLGETIVGRDCQIGQCCYLEHARVGDGCRIGAHAAVINAELPAGQTLEPYAVLKG